MSPHLNRGEIAELKAHHLACSHLIKGCQDAAIRLRRDRAAELRGGQHLGIEYRAIEILEDVLGSWCNTLSILRANLNQASSGRVDLWERPPHDAGVFSHDMAAALDHVADTREL